LFVIYVILKEINLDYQKMNINLNSIITKIVGEVIKEIVTIFY